MNALRYHWLVAVALLACSTHDASVGDALPHPDPNPPLQLTCKSVDGTCLVDQPGACSQRLDARCDDARLICCAQPTPAPTSPCDSQAGTQCVPAGGTCLRPRTGPGYECQAGAVCCDRAPGSGGPGGTGGSDFVGMGAPGGYGGE